MHPANINPLDAIDLELLRLLQANARLSYRDLGKAVHLSSTSAAARVRRLEGTGVISAYQAKVSPEAMGRPVQAFLRLRTTPDRYTRIVAELEKRPGVIECRHVTGEDSFVIRAWLGSLEELSELVALLSPYGETSTSLVLSTLLERPLPC